MATEPGDPPMEVSDEVIRAAALIQILHDRYPLDWGDNEDMWQHAKETTQHHAKEIVELGTEYGGEGCESADVWHMALHYVEQFPQWLQMEHDGSCVKQPAACLRCWAEEIVDDALAYVEGRYYMHKDEDGEWIYDQYHKEKYQQ